jgi:hypothetical protein
MLFGLGCVHPSMFSICVASGPTSKLSKDVVDRFRPL